MGDYETKENSRMNVCKDRTVNWQFTNVKIKQLLQIVSVMNELFNSTTQSWQSQNWQACAQVRARAHTHGCVHSELARCSRIYRHTKLRMQKQADLAFETSQAIVTALSRTNPHNKSPGNIFGAPT